MKAMQRLQPKMKAIQEKYKGDKMKANEALAQLYKSEGVNPLAGCLPLLIQMPILTRYFLTASVISSMQVPLCSWGLIFPEA